MLFSSKRRERPPMPVRYQKYLFELAELREFIQEAHALYEETGSERALRMYRRFAWMLEERKSDEELYQAEEMAEFRQNEGKYAHSVITWYKYYRDKEMEYED